MVNSLTCLITDQIVNHLNTHNTQFWSKNQSTRHDSIRFVSEINYKSIIIVNYCCKLKMYGVNIVNWHFINIIVLNHFVFTRRSVKCFTKLYVCTFHKMINFISISVWLFYYIRWSFYLHYDWFDMTQDWLLFDVFGKYNVVNDLSCLSFVIFCLGAAG